MSQVYVCIQYQGIRHMGGLHYADLDFSVETPDMTRNATGIIRKKSQRGLIPLTEKNLGKMAEYLISRLKMPFGSKPNIFLDFDSRKILANENQMKEIYLDERSGELFDYSRVGQKTLDRIISSFSKANREIVMQAIKSRV